MEFEFYEKDLRSYQQNAIEFIKAKKKCALFLDMGLGKTVITLTAIRDLLKRKPNAKILILATLRVANTVWAQECLKWDHLSHIKTVIGTGAEKRRLENLESDFNIYISNREKTKWLVTNTKFTWDMIVIDESSGFKSWTSQRFKALKMIAPSVESIVLLSGTPSPNGHMDLWSQIFLLDRGARLGRNITIFRCLYFHASGYKNYNFVLKENADDIIKNKIKDICLTMKADDYIGLPSVIETDIVVEFPFLVFKQYHLMQNKFILALKDGEEVKALSKVASMNKLLQMCNGAIYDEEKNIHEIHQEKIKALHEITEDYPNENLFVAYNFQSDLIRLKKAFPEAISLSTSGEELESWNRGEIKMLIAHPASAGHGLNAQHGGSIVVWFGLNWSLELYQQFNARLHRQGQKRPVKIIRIIAKDAIDQLILKALKNKAITQDAILEYFKIQTTLQYFSE